MQPHYAVFTAKPGEGGLDWRQVQKTGRLPLNGTEPLLQALAAFGDHAREHMTILVTEVLKVRDRVVQTLVGRTRVVVATMDAYCKYKAGKLGGVPNGVLQNLVTKVALVDECEAYHIDQAVAALGGARAFETVIFFGDENQHLEAFHANPAFTRCPWVSTSSRDGAPARAVNPRDAVAGIHIEEEDGAGPRYAKKGKGVGNSYTAAF